MSTISYIKECKAFMRFAADNGLSGPERELWRVLLDLFNERADGNQWPDGFLRLPNKVVLSWLSYGDDTLAKARNRLAQRGLIEFVRGNRREDLPMYRMVWLTAPRLNTPAEVDPLFYPQFYPKISGKNGVCSYSDNIDGTETETWDSVLTEELGTEEEEEQQPRARAREAAEAEEGESEADRERAGAVKEGFRESFGRQPHRAEVSRIALAARLLGFSPEMIRIAIKAAAEHGASAPAMYAVQVLNDLDGWGVYTPEQYSMHMLHYRTGDMDITQQLREANERRHEHREVVRNGLDSGLGFPGGGAETPEARGRARPGGPAAAGRRGPGDGIAGPGPDRQPGDAGQRQGGPGGGQEDLGRDPGSGVGSGVPGGG